MAAELTQEWIEAGRLSPGDDVLWAGEPARVLEVYPFPTTEQTRVTVFGGLVKKPSELILAQRDLFQRLGGPLPYPLDETLTVEQLRSRADEAGYIWGIIPLDLCEVIGNDFESVLDLLSTRLTGTDLLMDSGYTVIGHAGSTLHLYVRGDASMILDDADGEDEEGAWEESDGA